MDAFLEAYKPAEYVPFNPADMDEALDEVPEAGRLKDRGPQGACNSNRNFIGVFGSLRRIQQPVGGPRWGSRGSRAEPSQ
eukprot:3532116-Alexandrium_andersonii.AAC.1